MDLLIEGATKGEKGGIHANSSKVVSSSVVSEVHPVREVLSRRRCRATWMARFVGTLVKRETTSKEIRVLSSLKVCEDMNVAKTVELAAGDLYTYHTQCREFVTNGSNHWILRQPNQVSKN